MSSFTEPLTVTKTGPRTWTVERGFQYFVGEEGSPDFIDVPKGFETDFASVPRGLWNLFPPDGEYTQAAVLHDYLYNIKSRKRKECDKIFDEGMKVLNVPYWKRALIYRAVRMFGGFAWKA